MRRGVSRHPPRSSFPLRATPPRTKRSSVIHPPQSISSIPLVAEGWLCCLARGSLQPAPRHLIPPLCRSSQEKGLLIDFYQRFFEPTIKSSNSFCLLFFRSDFLSDFSWIDIVPCVFKSLILFYRSFVNMVLRDGVHDDSREI